MKRYKSLFATKRQTSHVIFAVTLLVTVQLSDLSGSEG